MSYSELDKLNNIAKIIQSVANEYNVTTEKVENVIISIITKPKGTITNRKPKSKLELELEQQIENLEKLNEEEIEKRSYLNSILNKIDNQKQKREVYKKNIEIENSNLDSLNNKLTKDIDELKQVENYIVKTKTEIQQIKTKIEETSISILNLQKEKNELIEQLKAKEKEKNIIEYDTNGLKRNLQETQNPKSSSLVSIFLIAMTVIGIILAIYFILTKKNN